MNTRFLLAAALLAAAAGLGLALPHTTLAPTPTSAAAPTQYEIDAGHSAILFRAKHLGVSYAYGRFNEYSGTVTFDPDKVEASKISIKLSTQTIDSGIKNRDDHLRSPDFLDAAQFPEAKFESKSVKKKDAKNFTVEGDLTLHGVTKPVKLDVEHTGSGKHERMGELAGFHGTLNIKRGDFGMSFMLEGLSDEVALIISLECVKRGESAAK